MAQNVPQVASLTLKALQQLVADLNKRLAQLEARITKLES